MELSPINYFGIALAVGCIAWILFTNRKSKNSVGLDWNNSENWTEEQHKEAFMEGLVAEPGEDESCFYIKIPGDIQPMERGERFEEPLLDALEAADIGEVTGGGSQLGEGNMIEYGGIDVVVTNSEEGLKIMREVLLKNNAPEGTVIEQTHPEKKTFTLTEK